MIFRNTNFDVPTHSNLTFILKKSRQQLSSHSQLMLTWVALSVWPGISLERFQLSERSQSHFSTTAINMRGYSPLQGVWGPMFETPQLNSHFGFHLPLWKLQSTTCWPLVWGKSKIESSQCKAYEDKNKISCSRLVFWLQRPKALPHSNWHSLKLVVFLGLYNYINSLLHLKMSSFLVKDSWRD